MPRHEVRDRSQPRDHLAFDPWRSIGIDAVAAIVNDLACVGALPLTVNAYFATGSASWYAGPRHRSLVEGWRQACEAVGAAWVGGESPTLSGLIDPDQIDIAGSALGRVPEGAAPWLGASLTPGDEIVIVASSGLHANGASLARAVASESGRLPTAVGWSRCQVVACSARRFSTRAPSTRALSRPCTRLSFLSITQATSPAMGYAS